MDYVIGCDIGSQGTKAVLVSLEGEIVAEAIESYGIDYPQPVWAEQPADRWLAAISGAVREALRLAQVDPARVQAIGTAAQVDGVVPVDRDGRPLRPAIIWMDRRASEQCARVGQLVERFAAR